MGVIGSDGVKQWQTDQDKLAGKTFENYVDQLKMNTKLPLPAAGATIATTKAEQEINDSKKEQLKPELLSKRVKDW